VSEGFSIAVIWFVLLLPIPMIVWTWFALLTRTRGRIPRTTRAAAALLTVSYLLLLLELIIPEILGEHYGNRRVSTIIANIGVATAVGLAGVLSRNAAGFALALSATIVGLGWLYMGVIGTAV